MTSQSVSTPAVATRVYDVAIVGAGIFGLWIARKASAAGLDVCLVDRAKPGAGASGGVLGALMPHMPDRWNDKKAFQFDALTALRDEIAGLEDDTGLSAGYRRTGRVMPVRKQGFLDQIERRREGSLQFWQSQVTGLALSLEDAPPETDWPIASEAPLGLMAENLSARVFPKSLCDALSVFAHRSCTVIADFEVGGIDAASGILTSCDGKTRISAGRIVLASGFDAFGTLETLTGLRFGTGVQGQAVLLDTNEDPDRPILYDDGCYVIVHDDGRTAIGSSSNNQWRDGTVPDPADRAFLDRAFKLVPRLRDAPIAEWWAGIRPKCLERDPMIGTLPGLDRIVVAVGGFKIGFGIAHACADVVRGCLMEDPLALPETFTPAFHLAKAEKRRSAGQSR